MEGLGVVGVFVDAAVFKKGPQKRRVRFGPVQLPLVGEDQAGKLPLLPLGIKVRLPGILQLGQQRGAVLVLLHARFFRGGGVLLGLGVQGEPKLVQQGK